MPEYYEDPDQRPAWVTRLFDDTATDYDRIERWVSLGTGGWYRRSALRRAGLRAGMRVLDVATGTGLVAREAKRIVGESGLIVGVDPSSGMRRLAEAGVGIETREGTAEALPAADSSFDFVAMGYALRHLSGLRAAFGEFARVLRPGGRVCILEITRPRSRLGRVLVRAQLSAVPRVARMVRRGPARTAELWRYYWDTIDRCVPPSAVVETLAQAGFEDARHTATLGVFSEYTGVKAGGSPAGATPRA